MTLSSGLEKVQADGSPRILVAVLYSPDLAKQKHNYGRGRPIYRENGRIMYWVNPGLIKADHVTNYNLRLKRRDNQREVRDQQLFKGNRRQWWEPQQMCHKSDVHRLLWDTK